MPPLNSNRPRGRLTQTFETNTFGPLEITQVFLPFHRKPNDAQVINVSRGSGQIERLSPDVPSYCLSTLALNGLAIMLADARRRDPVAVNSMWPGWVRTHMSGPNATLSVE